MNGKVRIGRLLSVFGLSCLAGGLALAGAPPGTSPGIVAGATARSASGRTGALTGGQPSATLNPLVFSQNIEEARILFIDPIKNTRVIDYQPISLLADHCLNRNGEKACALIGGHHSVIDDRDYVEFSAVNYPSLTANVARVSLGEPRQLMWRLQRMDFSETQSNGKCTMTCGDTGPVQPACLLGEVHEIVIADENPDEQWVELILADLASLRVERVHLDYRDGNTCGKVQWVLDDSAPDWPQGAPWPNGVQLLHEPEGDFLITTLHSQDAEVQVGGGRIMLWDLASGHPEFVWAYPSADVAEPYLNTVHNGLVQTNPVTGKRYLLYAHSLALSPIWGQGSHGTWGIAALDDLLSPPDYLGDWSLPRTYGKLNFPRTLQVLPDGTFFGMDAGCYLEPPGAGPCPASVYWFQPKTLPSSDLGGYYTRNQDALNVVQLPDKAIKKEVTCGLKMLFEADVIQPSELGQDLRQAEAEGGTACPE